MSLISVAFLKVYARLGWTHLSTHPGRTALTMIGVALGVAASIAVQTANVEVLRSFEESVLSVAGPVTFAGQHLPPVLPSRLSIEDHATGNVARDA